MKPVTNIVFAGLGGQGILTVSDILAQAAFQSGYDVKKSDIHGMAQRGGSVTSDLRYGEVVYSPMIALGTAHYVIALDLTQVSYASRWLAPQGLLIAPDAVDSTSLPNKRSLNIALLGLLTPHLTIDSEAVEAAIVAHLKPQLHWDSLNLYRRMVDKTRQLC